ncbi:hypothetical protein ACJJIE_21715 [Microbulbifer sp. TRSA001]|uniref:hypothetical protein n=1 Tax=Microbulbifer sp. TRSA001 TaxID=3243381 RepID=UPI004039FC6F
MNKDKKKRQLQKRQRRQYRKYIYALCRKASKGNDIAAAELESQMKEKKLANWAVKHWLKMKKIPLQSPPRKEKETLSPEEQAHRRRFQQMGFHEGAKVAGSNLRKVTK